jgi:hypothetical protein
MNSIGSTTPEGVVIIPSPAFQRGGSSEAAAFIAAVDKPWTSVHGSGHPAVRMHTFRKKFSKNGKILASGPVRCDILLRGLLLK